MVTVIHSCWLSSQLSWYLFKVMCLESYGFSLLVWPLPYCNFFYRWVIFFSEQDLGKQKFSFIKFFHQVFLYICTFISVANVMLRGFVLGESGEQDSNIWQQNYWLYQFYPESWWFWIVHSRKGIYYFIITSKHLYLIAIFYTKSISQAWKCL